MHVYLFSKNQDISSADRKKIQQALSTDKFELLVKTSEKTAQITLHGKENNGLLTQLYAEMKVNGIPVYLILSGKILLEELSKMNFNFEGSNALKNIPVP
jgi:diphthamide synthase subunit DPH2